MKPPYLTKAPWARNGHDVLPFLIPFQNFHRYTRKPPDQVAVFKYLPHIIYVLYQIKHVNRKNKDVV